MKHQDPLCLWLLSFSPTSFFVVPVCLPALLQPRMFSIASDLLHTIPQKTYRAKSQYESHHALTPPYWDTAISKVTHAHQCPDLHSPDRRRKLRSRHQQSQESICLLQFQFRSVTTATGFLVGKTGTGTGCQIGELVLLVFSKIENW